MLEEKIVRIMDNKEPIEDGAPEIFTEKNQGVIAAYNIRTDRWEVAVDAYDKIEKSRIAKKEATAKEEDEAKKAKMEIVKNKPTQATDDGAAAKE